MKWSSWIWVLYPYIFIHRTRPPEAFGRDRPKSTAVCYPNVKPNYFIFLVVFPKLYQPFPWGDVNDANKSDNNLEAKTWIIFSHPTHFQPLGNKALGPMTSPTSGERQAGQRILHSLIWIPTAQRLARTLKNSKAWIIEQICRWLLGVEVKK